MKKALSLILAACLLMSVLAVMMACDTSTKPNAEKLEAPIITLEGDVATWQANEKADKFEISLDGSLFYLENSVTSKKLTDGQTIKIRAVGDGVTTLTSDWSNAVTYNKPADSTETADTESQLTTEPATSTTSARPAKPGSYSTPT